MKHGYCYLAAVMDCYSSYIISWEMDTSFVLRLPEQDSGDWYTGNIQLRSGKPVHQHYLY